MLLKAGRLLGHKLSSNHLAISTLSQWPQNNCPNNTFNTFLLHVRISFGQWWFNFADNNDPIDMFTLFDRKNWDHIPHQRHYIAVPPCIVLINLLTYSFLIRLYVGRLTEIFLLTQKIMKINGSNYLFSMINWLLWINNWWILGTKICGNLINWVTPTFQGIFRE